MLCHVASSAGRLELEPGKVWERKIGTTSVGCKLCDRQTSSTILLPFFESVSRAGNFLSFLECPFKFKMVKKKNSETNSKNLRISILLDEISLGGPAYFRRQTRC